MNPLWKKMHKSKLHPKSQGLTEDSTVDLNKTGRDS
jgi:hypothetical protein